MRTAEKIQTVKKSHPFKLWDLSIYVLIVAAVVLLLIAASRPQGDTVRIVYYDAAGKKITIEKPLDVDDTIELPLPDGEHYLIIIEGGKVWTEDSDCRDKVCMGMGKISRVNQQIICLPFKITVTIIGKSDSDIAIT